MIARLGDVLTRWTRRWLPDTFVIAILLLLGAGAAGVVHCGDPGKVLDAFGTGFWDLLRFAMQMCLVLVSGHALAGAPVVRAGLRRLAARPKTTAEAAALISLAAMTAALLNWGLGLIVGAFLAREAGRSARARGIAMHYPILAAAGYSGLMIWHGGLSGSAPLDVTRATPPIPLTQTIFAPLNLALTLSVLALTPVVYRLLASRPPDHVEEADLPPDPPPPPVETSPAAALERSFFVTLVVVAAAAWFLARGLAREGWTFVTLETVSFFFLMLAMAAHGRPISFANAVYDGAKSCGGIILQFPIYAATAAILQNSGLVRELAALSPQDPVAFRLVSFLSACVLNVFIPSGGGQWKVQGPLVLAAGRQAGVADGTGVMMVAYGDELTNMVQPFWALPLLGVTGVKARDMIGYTAAVMICVLPVYLIWIVVLG